MAVHEHQKQRPLLALERRFAAAKAELNNTVKSSDMASFKKGNFTFAGHVASEDFDKHCSTYSKLSQSVHELLTTPNICGKKESRIDKILHDLFQNGDGSLKYKQGSRCIRIENRIQLDNYIKDWSVLGGSRLRALQIHSKRSKKHMSTKQLKKIGMSDLPKEFHRYELYRPMYENWRNMMTQLVKKNGTNQLAQYFLDGDLRGALVSVVEDKFTSFTWVSGIMIRETADTFGIISQDDKFQVIPKKFSIFVFQFDTWKITMLGSELSSRNTSLLVGP